MVHSILTTKRYRKPEVLLGLRTQWNVRIEFVRFPSKTCTPQKRPVSMYYIPVVPESPPSTSRFIDIIGVPRRDR